MTQCLPVSAPFGADELYKAALSDKKRAGDTITYVLPQAIGDCRLHKIEVAQLMELIPQAIGE